MKLISVHREVDGHVLCIFHVRRFHPKTIAWLFAMLTRYVLAERRYLQLSTWPAVWVVLATFFRGTPQKRVVAI